MEEIKSYEKTYAEYKQELDRELNRTAEGFVSPIPKDAVPVVPDLG